jgi:hypothetical protein
MELGCERRGSGQASNHPFLNRDAPWMRYGVKAIARALAQWILP